MTHCPCCSGKQFKVCCGPFLSGNATPRTVKQLMRSRYCAFALGGYGEYLLHTWQPQAAPDISAEELGAADVIWTGLQIVNSTQHGDSGTVEFKATFVDEHGKPQIHHENSLFARTAGQWQYVSAL